MAILEKRPKYFFQRFMGEGAFRAVTGAYSLAE